MCDKTIEIPIRIKNYFDKCQIISINASERQVSIQIQ